MICEKCGRRYEDDMPKCLWCDEPNPNYVTEDAPEPENAPVENAPAEEPAPVETKIEEKAGKVKEKTKKKSSAEKSSHSHSHGNSDYMPRKSAVPVFWLCLLLGSCGAHCFWSGRRARGVQYLLWGGAIFALAYCAFASNASIIPSWFVVLGLGAACIVQLLVIKDLWKISIGKYRSRKTFRRYKASPIWMVPITIVMTAVTLFSVYTCCSTILVDNVLKQGRGIASKMELDVEAYMIAQQNYFEKNGKIGTLSEVGFHSMNTNSPYYTYESAGTALKIVYIANLNCPTNTAWLVEPSVLDSTLLWKVTLPEEAVCNAMAPQMVTLEQKTRALADSAVAAKAAASAAQLDEGVDGVGVVPDSTQQGNAK